MSRKEQRSDVAQGQTAQLRLPHAIYIYLITHEELARSRNLEQTHELTNPRLHIQPESTLQLTKPVLKRRLRQGTTLTLHGYQSERNDAAVQHALYHFTLPPPAIFDHDASRELAGLERGFQRYYSCRPNFGNREIKARVNSKIKGLGKISVERFLKTLRDVSRGPYIYTRSTDHGYSAPRPALASALYSARCTTQQGNPTSSRIQQLASEQITLLSDNSHNFYSSNRLQPKPVYALVRSRKGNSSRGTCSSLTVYDQDYDS
ncbi:leucine-rich repeat receptor-like serine/threonine-protein kinase [Dorcoceras hygrometricum]|uniref:Leucine-rich repeat receptor-like serine/threonine-protein kinase n=1 Tax=Dorcoceras hygrometricum TaxID=472368 RepID=A0A2Z7CLJ7_9LAMI|nr:leucine-rich repeat receptor-like serine/threonine-protein kinase [Dorcoceras hygrometricum]